VPAGITGDEVIEADVPVELVAVALNVYEVPFDNGEIEQAVAGAITAQVAPPGEAVTVYELGAPPFPAARVIVAPPSVAVADEMAGVAGIAIFHCAITVELAPAIIVG
jgi:hypothetical protein